MVVLRSKREIEGLRRVGDLVARTFAMLRSHVRPGVRLAELDLLVEEFLLSGGGYSPYKGYQPSPRVPPFPGTVCAAVNEQVVHGFPTSWKLEKGGIVGIDIGTVLDGWVGDACYTYPVGEVLPPARKLLDVTQQCPYGGLAEVKPGKRLGDVGVAIQEIAESSGYGVVRELGGHGVGREPHVEHFGHRGHGLRLREGMVFTIEPMINLGRRETKLLPDGWTVVTADGRPSAQFEHTLVVTPGGHDILTLPLRPVGA